MLEHIIFYVERNAIAQLYVKLKLHVSGRLITSHDFRGKALGKTRLDTTTTTLIPSAREQQPKCALCHAILQTT
ncbi:hypothetical protein HanIR_Chr03g0147861 [Helianthus annuus]|nr:hypothetical protein HanIR_Chr03g0147861 [Helianthus annuus]